MISIEELPSTPSPTVIRTSRLTGVVLAPLTVMGVPSSVTVTFPEAMEEGTVVPLGKVTVIASPLPSPVLPIAKLSATCAVIPVVEGSRVTLGAVTSLDWTISYVPDGVAFGFGWMVVWRSPNW